MDINSVAFLFLLRSYSLNWRRWGGGGGGGPIKTGCLCDEL